MKLVTCVAAVLLPSLAIAYAYSTGKPSAWIERSTVRAPDPAGNLAIPKCVDCGHISLIEELAPGTALYRVTVGMENGGARTVDVESVAGLASGKRVIIVRDKVRALDPFMFQ